METLVLDIPISEYLADPAPAPSLTRSLIVTLLAANPLQAWQEHPRLNPEPDESDGNRATDMGSSAHAWLCEGKQAFEVIDPKDHRNQGTKSNPDGDIPAGWTNKAMKEARDGAIASGRIPILPADYAALKGMVEVATSTMERAGIVLSDYIPEQSIIWQDGCWLRTRPDLTKKDGKRVIEYKTTTLSKRDWIRQMASKGYDIQAFMHREGVARARAAELPIVTFAVQNIEPPYQMFFAELSPLYYELAGRKVERAVSIWSQCLEAGKWPGYEVEPEIIDPSSWQIAAEEERAIEHEGWSLEAFLFGQVKGGVK